MATVLAVALLLLCGNAQSAEEGAAAYVTQVKTSSSTAPAMSPAMAPAITTTTEGSSTTHSAVLSAVEQGQDTDFVLVDLARADDEKLLNVASAPEPSPSGKLIPDGFDMEEAEAPVQTFSTEEEAPEPAAAGPESAYSNADQEQGTLVADVDGAFPSIDDKEDNSAGRGYGVQSFEGGNADGQSFAAMDEGASFAADPSEQGQLLTGSYPTIDGKEDNSAGRGYGVQSFEGGNADGQSFAAMDEGASFAADPSEQGQLLTGSYPTIDGKEDNSAGRGYGVQSFEGGNADGQSFAASGNDTSETTGFALTKSKTYSGAPKSKKTWGKGKCTFYGGMDAAGTMSGACGYGNLYASGYGAYTAALSSALFKNGMACGACYEVVCSGAKSCKPGSVLVTVTNFCPPNPGRSADNGGWCNGANQHFDLSYPAFAKIADPKAGVVPVNYRRVPCKKQGAIRFTMNGNCNFNLVTITNVGGSGVVTEAYMKGDKMDWAPMSRNWGANWQCSRNYCGKGISIKIVTSDKKVSVSRLAGPEWAFGKTYIGQQVY